MWSISAVVYIYYITAEIDTSKKKKKKTFSIYNKTIITTDCYQYLLLLHLCKSYSFILLFTYWITMLVSQNDRF